MASRPFGFSKDFFVSYTGSDLNYATWVAEIFEEKNYKVTIQAWDFKPGDNFISKILPNPPCSSVYGVLPEVRHNQDTRKQSFPKRTVPFRLDSSLL